MVQIGMGNPVGHIGLVNSVAHIGLVNAVLHIWVENANGYSNKTQKQVWVGGLGRMAKCFLENDARFRLYISALKFV